MIPSPSLNPFPWYRQMQQEKPVYYDADFILNWGDKGAWQVFRHEDVKRVLSEYSTFSNNFTPEDNLANRSLITQDPPVHRRLRSIVSDAFVPRVINQLEPWIRELCIGLIQPHLDYGRMDFVKEYAIPIPVRVICQMLGVPAEMHNQVHKWSKVITSNPAKIKGVSAEEAVQAYNQAQNDLENYFRRLVQERKTLINEGTDSPQLTEDEIVSFCLILLIAGNETTANLIGSTLLTLTEYPELQKQLVYNSSELSKVIQESLRFRSPVQSLFRIAKQDVDLSGQQIKKGDYIIAWIGSANHDPSVFPNPEQFDINRDNQAQASFGHGIHYCLGAPLAKLEARVAFEVLFEHIQDVQLQPNTTLSVHPSTLVYSLTSLPITFQKR